MCDPVPALRDSRPPEYPTVESLIPIEGYAIVEITVTEGGVVVGARLIETVSDPESKGFSRGFGRSAIEAVKTWQFAPVDKECRLRQTLRFKIE